ncbi:TrkA C-terminal domain-containing protein [Alloyangia pacifica]|uniref:Putative transport protein n=1 Tax=Alloyangia pacifica TaxID=311180 RepID=A0A1I6UN22_9RHOB|nr:TrkA C-terminal domain-containing protein [Alloyangia pacifica]SDH76006.1 putative transport protein [Alloyangia pacifica]SFT02811.1 putative transport protein [Alloyangia pacifica]
MTFVTDFLTGQPELTIFLTIALGYAFGALRLGDFSFGPVAGALFAGLIIGQVGVVPVSGTAKSFLFDLFLFGVGYSAGPQFLQALRQVGANSVLLALVVSLTGLLVALLAARLGGFDPGLGAGMMAGALTQSPAIGAAGEAISHLPLPEAERALLTSHVAVGYAVCYIIGSTAAIWFCSYMGPRLLGLDLVQEARELGRSLGIGEDRSGVIPGYQRFPFRAYRLPAGSPVVGQTLGEAEADHAAYRLHVLRLRRGGQLITPELDTVLHAGDILAVSGQAKGVIELLAGASEELADAELLDLPFRATRVMVTQGEVIGMTLGTLGGQDWARGMYLEGLSRAAVDLPVAPGIRLERGDVLKFIGPEELLARTIAQVGREVTPPRSTDVVVLGLMIFLGGLVGTLIHVTLAGIEIRLGTSVGILLAGLATGYMRSRFPLFGQIPDAAVSLMTTLGLAAFIAMVGLQAAPDLVPALKSAGLLLPLLAFAVAIAPLAVGALFGHFVLKMNPVVLFGGLAGSQTATPAMAAVQARAQSPLPVLGYAPTYPVSQVLLTLWGGLMVALLG